MTYDLRLGRYQDVLADVEVDAVIADPPFGQRTHAAWRSTDSISTELKRGAITYTSWSSEDVADFVAHWAPRCRGWIVAMTSHDLAPYYEAAYVDAGLYAFAPIPCVTWGGSIRLSGDGPSSWTVWLMVARPKTRDMQRWGTLPGAYVNRGNGVGIDSDNDSSGRIGGRGKPLDLMRAIVNDYSRPGDLVCDPTAGYGSTLAAALQRGRKAIGAEIDPEVYVEARKRLDLVHPVDLFDPGRAVQTKLL